MLLAVVEEKVYCRYGKEHSQEQRHLEDPRVNRTLSPAL